VGSSYSGRMLIDGEIFTPAEATKRFLGDQALDAPVLSFDLMFQASELRESLRNVAMVGRMQYLGSGHVHFRVRRPEIYVNPSVIDHQKCHSG